MKKRIIQTGVTSFMLMVFPLSAATVLDLNFNNATVGSAPPANALTAGAGTEIRVVNSASTPADPFGGTENRSLLIRDAGTGVATITWNTSFTKRMVLSMKAYVTSNASFDNVNFGMVVNTEGGQAVSFSIMKNGFYVYDGTANGFAIQKPGDSSGLFDYNKVWDIVLTINPLSNTWSAKVNGQNIERAGVTEFGFRNAGTEIRTLTFQTNSANTGTQIFLDDVRLMPGEIKLIIMSSL